MASLSLRTVHLVWEAVSGGAQAVCIVVGHSKDTEMQGLVIPQAGILQWRWLPWTPCKDNYSLCLQCRVRGYTLFWSR